MIRDQQIETPMRDGHLGQLLRDGYCVIERAVPAAVLS